jgi:serine/threonine-protein kinase
MPPARDPARDLLFGLLALQTGLINQAQLVAAFHAWTQARDRTMAAILAEQGALATPCLTLVEGLVIEHLRRHGSDPERSLAAIGVGRSTRECLARIGDRELDASLARVGSGSTEHDNDPDRTATYPVGTATSAGLRFRVLRPHARGGLGAVFVALDSELHREVALKQILDSHADDPTSRQRFLLEAEVTGGLEHPGIVPVYGLGTYGDGRPYYAMRFIKGDSLRKAIAQFHTHHRGSAGPAGADPGARTGGMASSGPAGTTGPTGSRDLALRKLLRRFLDVCNAIDYAHSRGVLHRDIKPGNVILGKHGETLVVDWGLAKPMGRVDPGSDAGERTLMPSSASGGAETLPGSALGTPAYMSPEQARGDLEQLGPRSDVYSLGATLYCLLTGRPSLDGDDTGELLRRAQHSEFPPPRQRDPSIDKALEAICLKAMATRPEDRYVSPRLLAEDVERWMADEPVATYPDPVARRLARWMRRHRPLVTGAAAAVAVALASSLLATALLSEANRLERSARELAQKNEQEARTNFRMAREAVDDYCLKVSEDRRLREGFRSLRKELLQSAVPFYQRLLDRGGDTAEMRRELARASFKLGEITAEIDDPKAAIPRYEQAQAILRRLQAEFPAEPDYQADLAQTNSSLARHLAATGRRAEAETAGRTAAELRRQLAARQPANPGRRSELAAELTSLGTLAYTFGQREPAEAAFREAIDLLHDLIRRQPDEPLHQLRLAKTYNALGVSYWAAGRKREQEEAWLASLGAIRSLNERYPADETYQDFLSGIQHNMGILYGDTERLAESERAYELALAHVRRLVEKHPEVVPYQHHLATWMDDLGTLYLQMRRYEDAERRHREVVSLLQRLVARYPEVLTYAADLIGSQSNLAQAMRRAGKAEASIEWWDRAIETGRGVLQKEPQYALARQFLSIAYEGRALALRNLDRQAHAAVDFGRAIEYDDRPFYRIKLRADRALALARAGDLARAEAEAEELFAQRSSLRPDDFFVLGVTQVVLAAKVVAGARMPEAERARRVEAHQSRAVALFVEARKAGYFDDPGNLQEFLTDGEFDRLRPRDDFRKLIRDLEPLMDRNFPADPFAPGA